MITRRIKDPTTGQVIEANVVDISKEENRAVILEMTDGAVLRLKVDVAEVTRIPDTLNALGEPIYVVKSGTSVSLLDPPTDHTF